MTRYTVFATTQSQIGCRYRPTIDRLDYCNSLLVNCCNRITLTSCSAACAGQFGPCRLQLQPLNVSWTTVTEPALAASPAADQLQTHQTLLPGYFFPTAKLPRWSNHAAHTVSLACCDHPHRSFCQFRRTTWTLLLVVSLLLLWDFGTLFHWTVELLHQLTHLRSVFRWFLFDSA